MTRIALCSFFLLFAGCILPERDNPNDSANVPVARLALVDTGPSSACPPADLNAEFDSVVGEVSRGRCLALDARSSSDPQGASDIESYEFSLPASLAIAAATTSNELGLLVLPEAYRRALPTDIDVTFGVIVRDRDGNRARKVELSADLKNAEPVASIQNGFALPRGGLPWAVGLPMNVVLDGSLSSDEDGDPLWYCWAVDGIPEPCVTGEAGASFSYDAPAAEGRHIVTLQVRDAEETGNARLSRVDFETVWVEPVPLWEVPGNGSADPLVKLDSSTWLPITANGANGVLHRADAVGQDLIATVTSVSPTLRAYSYPDFTPGAGLSVGSGGRLFSDAENNRVWLMRYLGGGNYRFEAYAPRTDLGFDDLNGGGSLDLSRPNDPFASAPIAMGPGGELWVGSNADLLLHTIAAPQAAPSAETIDAPFMDMGARPARNEMWLMVQAGANAEFRIYSAPGAVPEAVAPTDFAAFGFEWMSEEEMFITTPTGVLRVDAGLLRDAVASGMESSALALATIATADALIPSGNVVVDAPVLELWADGFRISADLSVQEGPPSSYSLPLFIDPDGYPWSNIGGLHRVRGMANDATLLAMSFPENASKASVDVVRGSAWVLTAAPPTIQEVTHDGRRGRRIPAIEMPGGDAVLVPAYENLSVMPDGAGAFAVDQEGSVYRVHRLDFTTSPPTAVESAVIDGNATGEYLYDFAGFEPSGRTSPPFVWTAANDSTDLYPVRISDEGVLRDTGITISSQLGDSLGIARSLADDGACIATMERVFVSGSTFQLNLNLYRALPGEAAVLLDSRSFAYTGGSGGGSTYSLPFVSATRAPGGGEMCWTGHVRTTNPATNQILTVFGAVEGLGTVRSFTYTGAAGEIITSVVATSPDEVWYLRDTTSASVRARRHSPNGSGVLAGETAYFSFDHVGEQRDLVSVESQSY